MSELFKNQWMIKVKKRRNGMQTFIDKSLITDLDNSQKVQLAGFLTTILKGLMKETGLIKGQEVNAQKEIHRMEDYIKDAD